MQPSDELQIDSATTGSEHRDNEGSKVIGERRGETGCVKIGMLIAEAVENIDRTRGTWEVAVRSVKSKKAWHTLPLESFLERAWTPPKELFDGRMPHWREEGIWHPPSLSDGQKTDLPDALAQARQAMRPAGAEALLALLMRLAAVVVMQDRTVGETMLEIYVEDLGDVPVDLLDGACRHWRRTQKFFPTIAELLELIEPELAQRRRRLVCLGTLEAIANDPAPDETFTLTWCEQVSAHGYAQVPA